MKNIEENMLDDKKVPNGCKFTAVFLALVFILLFVLGVFKLIQIIARWI